MHKDQTYVSVTINSFDFDNFVDCLVNVLTRGNKKKEPNKLTSQKNTCLFLYQKISPFSLSDFNTLYAKPKSVKMMWKFK